MPVKILIADDEPDLELLVRQRFRKQIRDKEYVFVFAQNGAEALDQYRNDGEIELVLTDINMPVMDGLTLLAKLMEISPLIQPVIVSAYGDMQNIRTAMNRGAFDFLTKPIDFVDFEVTMSKALQHERRLKESAQDREQLAAIQRELNIARVIQQSLLPATLPSFPGRTNLDLYATMRPARKVGGDLYDYYLLDADRLAVVIGDVSGKGVPAAIFMAMCRTALKAVAQQGASPAECLREANAFLCRENKGEMFVTVFYGILNLRTGELHYSNGGHNPPYTFGGSAGPRLLDGDTAGTVLGLMEEAVFETSQAQLQVGEGLLLYTDGLTEAMDAKGELFTAKRLEAFLQQPAGLSAAALIEAVLAAVVEYTGDTPQSDDITVLGVRYVGEA